MGSNERRERERQEVRTKILDAARELFSKEGFEAVTMRKVAEKIEYSATAIYFHFKDKDELIRELCVHDFLAFAQQFQKVAKIADPAERLRKAGHAYVDFAITHPNHYQLMFMNPPVMTKDDGRVDRNDPEKHAYAFLEQQVKDAHERGALRKEARDLPLVAQTIWAAMHGVAAIYVSKLGEGWLEVKPAKQAARFMVDTLIRGLFED